SSSMDGDLRVGSSETDAGAGPSIRAAALQPRARQHAAAQQATPRQPLLVAGDAAQLVVLLLQRSELPVLLVVVALERRVRVAQRARLAAQLLELALEGGDAGLGGSE